MAPRQDPASTSRHLGDATACTQPLATAVSARGLRAERETVQRASGIYLDVRPWICTGSTCAVIVDNLLVYRDDNHLSTSYPAWLSPLLAFELDQAIRTGHGRAAALAGQAFSARSPKPSA